MTVQDSLTIWLLRRSTLGNVLGRSKNNVFAPKGKAPSGFAPVAEETGRTESMIEMPEDELPPIPQMKSADDGLRIGVR